jgi:hypothetical protein
MIVTVRVDFSDHYTDRECAFSCLKRSMIVNYFDEISKDQDNIHDDMALILRVDGADIGVVCTHFSNIREQNAIELF